MMTTFPPLQFRFAQPSDAEMLAELRVAVTEKDNNTQMAKIPRMSLVGRWKDGLEVNLISGRHKALIAHTDNNPAIGYIEYRQRRDGLYVHSMYAHHVGEYRTGSALFKETCMTPDIQRIVFDTPTNNGRSVYLSWGAVKCTTPGRSSNDLEVFGENLDAWRKCEHGNYPRFKALHP